MRVLDAVPRTDRLVTSSRRAKFLGDVGRLQMSKQRIGGFLLAVVTGGQGNDRYSFVQASQQPAYAILDFAVADKNNGLVDIVQFDLFIRFFLQQVALR